VSLLEAYLAASAQVAEFYERDGRLASEHALLDDNGDGLGTPASWFRGVRATRTPEGAAATDGLRAHQMHLVRSAREQAMSPQVRAERDELERRIAQLRAQKSTMPENVYYDQLEPLLVELSRLYHDREIQAEKADE
jgi:hypothetical protein